MQLLICAGGTGGGVYPALSILQALERGGSNTGAPVGATGFDQPLPQPKQAGGVAAHFGGQVLWVGGIGGIETELVARFNIPFAAIPAAGLHGVGMRSLPGNLLKLAQGVGASRRILRSFRPDVILFTGGYVGVPMAVAARLAGAKRPRSVVYIPDIEPGMALKAMLRLADHAVLTVEDSRAYLPARLPATVTGYPLRSDLTAWQRPAALAHLGLQADLPVLLVTGGSKGARSINRALLAALPELLGEMQVIHLCGQLDHAEVQREAHGGIPPQLAQRYHLFSYLHEMGAAFAAADLVLSRAGASCLGEYPFFGLPAILVPYPYAWRYQRLNAEYLQQRGAALLLRDENLAAELAPQVRELMRSAPRRQAMSAAMRSFARPQAAQQIAEILTACGSGLDFPAAKTAEGALHG